MNLNGPRGVAAPARRVARARRLFAVVAAMGLLAVAAGSCADDAPLAPDEDASLPDAPTLDGPVDIADGAPHGGDANAAEAGAYLDAGAPCAEDAGPSCAPGLLCCTPCCRAGADPVCVKPVRGQCPLPNLSVNEAALGTGIVVETIEAGACELEEACLADAGVRRVLRFDVRIRNHGAADLILGPPDASAGFEFAACHDHYHFNGFARYSLLDDAGAVVVVGRKQAYCARDSVRVDPTASLLARYDCDHQGIQRGWEDIYSPDLPCQFLDVTDVPPGSYLLEVVVNPDRSMTELDYDDNRAAVPIVLPP